MKEFYINRTQEYSKTLKSLQAKRNRLAWSRLVSFLGIPFFFFLLAEFSVMAGLAGALIALIFLLNFILKDVQNDRLITRTEILLLINQQELKALDGDYSAFDSGEKFIDQKHPYTSDLDIFGISSLYQMICRATTGEGKTRLAASLKTPQPFDQITARQKAIAELADDPDFLQNFRAEGMLYSSKSSSLEHLFAWFSIEDLWTGNRWLRLAINILPLITFASGILWIFGLLNGLFIVLLMIHLLIYSFAGKHINQLHRTVSLADDELKSYSRLLSGIENRDFKSPYLNQLQQQLKNGHQQPSRLMKLFAGLVEKMDYRMNILFLMTVGLITFWDFRIAFRLVDWKQNHAGSVRRWIETVGEFESLHSLAIIKINYPDWVFPEVTDRYFELSALGIGHPLIPVRQRVVNNLQISAEESLLLLTGSNMAGKSTFLRTLGVNTVLAYAGAPVCADKFSVSYVPVLTSMRINDSLVDNTSSFYAEIKRLGMVVETVNSGAKSFILLDEILRGTNSHDRHLGSEALIDLLVRKRVFTIISTHDLRLAGLSEKYPANFVNYHFDVQVDQQDELFFDYKIKKGVCQSMNASILMRKIGLNV